MTERTYEYYLRLQEKLDAKSSAKMVHMLWETDGNDVEEGKEYLVKFAGSFTTAVSMETSDGHMMFRSSDRDVGMFEVSRAEKFAEIVE